MVSPIPFLSFPTPTILISTRNPLPLYPHCISQISVGTATHWHGDRVLGRGTAAHKRDVEATEKSAPPHTLNLTATTTEHFSIQSWGTVLKGRKSWWGAVGVLCPLLMLPSRWKLPLHGLWPLVLGGLKPMVCLALQI